MYARAQKLKFTDKKWIFDILEAIAGDAPKKKGEASKVSNKKFKPGTRLMPEAKTKEMAKKVRDEDFPGFPNDVVFHTQDSLRLIREYWKDFLGNHKTLTRRQELAVWDEDRLNAAVSPDIVEKRASMNDYLWEKFRDWKKATENCSVDRLKWFCEMDLARSALYPPADILFEKRKQEESKKEKLTFIDPEAPPPQWYLDSLGDTNQIQGIMENIKKVTHRKVKD